MSIFPEDSGASEDCDFEEDSKMGRSSYSMGGTTGMKSTLTSVHRLTLLCIVPQIKESYENIDLIYKLTNLKNISFNLVSDFKVLLTINGQQTALATYPCPYCFVSLNDLKNSDADFEGGNKTLKTYKDLRADYNKFCSFDKDKKSAKECGSTVNLSLFAEEDDTPLIKKCVVPELHLLQGFVNHMFWKVIVLLVGREKALIWPKKVKTSLQKLLKRLAIGSVYCCF